MKNDQPIIQLKDVSFSYGDDLVLDRINLTVERGEYLGIVGPNGGGKTTLLKIMLGLLSPAQGESLLFGTKALEHGKKGKIGYVSQKATQVDQNFPLTVEGVVRMGCCENGCAFRFSRREEKDKIDRALRRVSMEEHRKRLIGDLSGGQQQRVFVARALAGDPDILVLDEPTAGIDEKTQQQLYALLKTLNRESRLTIILVSHDLDTVECEATKLCCINRTIVYYGPPQEFKSHERYAAFREASGTPVHH